ncbi:MAG TPA: hypothetical protein VGG67_02140 [Steroidobacteraceae bacterium]
MSETEFKGPVGSGASRGRTAALRATELAASTPLKALLRFMTQNVHIPVIHLDILRRGEAEAVIARARCMSNMGARLAVRFGIANIQHAHRGRDGLQEPSGHSSAKQ